MTALSLPPCVCLSLCECCACLFCVCVAGLLSKSPWWRGGHVAQILLSGRHLKLLNILLHLCFNNLHFCHHNFIYYDFLLMIYSVHMTSVVLTDICQTNDWPKWALPEFSQGSLQLPFHSHMQYDLESIQQETKASCEEEWLYGAIADYSR